METVWTLIALFYWPFPHLQQQQQKQQQQQQQQHKKWDPRQRDSSSQHLTKPMIVFLVVLILETMTRLLVSYIAPNDHDEQQHRPMILFSSIFKPMVLYYVSKRARDALAALRRILRTVMRVLLMELLIILMFAAIACRLFANFERFRDLSTAWLSLFELATTVVNPSIWLPMVSKVQDNNCLFVVHP
jgi:cation transport ATPase